MKNSGVKRKIVRTGIAALGGVLIAIALAVSPVGATPFTSHGTGQFWSVANTDTNGDGIPHTQSLISGSSTLVGASECITAAEYQLNPTPSGNCDGVEFSTLPGGSFICQSEDGDGIAWGTIVATACLPLSCFDANSNVVVGCTTTGWSENQITGGTGMWEGATGTYTTTGPSTYTTPSSGTASFDSVGDITLVDGDPPNDLNLEDPAEGSTQSGIGLVRGWSCLGGNLEVQFSEADGTDIGGRLLLAHGTPRADTEDACGDTNNGFAMHINWSLLGTGEKTATLFVNDEERATQNFSVADPGM